MVLKFFILLFWTSYAFAYIPPVHFQIKKICEGRQTFKEALITMSALKPATDSKSQEEIIFQTAFRYSPIAAWPALPLLLESNTETLRNSWKNFGPIAPLESELLAHKPEQFQKMENAPTPFYRLNPQLSLKRFPGGLAYASTNDEKLRSIWIEKESFRPVSLHASCPAETNKLSWIRSSDSNCHLEFEKNLNFKPTPGKSFRFVLKNDKQSLMVFKIDSVRLNPSENELKRIENQEDPENKDAETARALIKQIFN